MTFTSQQACHAEAADNFTFILDAKCSQSEGTKFVSVKETACSTTFQLTGKQGCMLYEVKLQKYINKLAPFVGGILIVMGLAFTFAGAKFLFFGFAALVFLLVSALLFLIIYNFLPVSAGLPVVIGTLVVSILAGFGVSFFTFKFGKEWAVCLLAAWGGIVLALIIVELFGITNPMIELVLVVVLAVGCGYVGKQMNKLIRCLGTAFVGAFLIVRGIAFYAGGYPSEFGSIDAEDLKEDSSLLAYFIGFLLITVVGTLCQLYFFRNEGKDDDDYMATEDEGRKCGCF